MTQRVYRLLDALWCALRPQMEINKKIVECDLCPNWRFQQRFCHCQRSIVIKEVKANVKLCDYGLRQQVSAQ